MNTQISENIAYWTNYIQTCRKDYTEITCTGFTTSFSELLMHTRQTEKKIVKLFLNPSQTYAYAITEEGILIDGCYHHFSDNSISLS